MAKVTQEQFIINAMKVHGARYRYNDVIYIKSSLKVVINCTLHGPFQQTPNSHLNGSGCPSCSGNKKKSNQEFIAAAIKIHGNKYDYSRAVYTSIHGKVKILCKIHDFEFEQEANSHLQGCGCPKCAREKTIESVTKGFHYFTSRSRVIHNNKFEYDESSYVNVTTKTKIKCKTHGWFTKTPDKHMQGQGCPSCSTSGFDKSKSGIIYFLHSDVGIKVGITNDLPRRMAELKRSTPFSFKIINHIEMSGYDAFKEEKRLHEKYDVVGLSGFDGATEWLKHSIELMKEIMK
ncbi:hypothetical protein [Citrobacter phage vB_CfrS_K1M]